MTTILLIRHGENNMVGKRLAGRLPGVHLNDKGKQQAEQVAQVLCKAPIRAIYSSPLERAVETAEPLARMLGLEIQPAPGLIELAYGDWQGKTLKQLARLKLWKVVQEKPSEMRFPKGESFVEVQERAAAEIERIAAAHEEQDLVACFSHGDIIRLAVSYYLGVPLDLFQRVAANPASISVIHLDKKGRPFVMHVNQVLTFEFKQEKADPAGGKTESVAQTTASVENVIQEAVGKGVDAITQADPSHVEVPEDPAAEHNKNAGPSISKSLGSSNGSKKGKSKPK